MKRILLFLTMASLMMVLTMSCDLGMREGAGGVQSGARWIRGLKAVAGGASHSLALTTDGRVYATGYNYQGQLGLGHYTNVNYWQLTWDGSLGAAKAIACGGFHSLILTDTGAVYATGLNNYGQFGIGPSSVKYSTWILVQQAGVLAIAAGRYHSMAIHSHGGSTDYGILQTTGNNSSGQCGIPDRSTNYWGGPTIADYNYVRAIAAGDTHSLIIDYGGYVQATGSNSSGQLGLPREVQKRSTFVITGGPGCSAISAGARHSLVLCNNGIAYGTGANNFCQLIERAETQSNGNVYGWVILADNISEVAAGGHHTIVKRFNGETFLTGCDYYGQVAASYSDPRYARQFAKTTWAHDWIPEGANVAALGAGYDHSMAITYDGYLWVTGSNHYGQLGFGSDPWDQLGWTNK